MKQVFPHSNLDVYIVRAVFFSHLDLVEIAPHGSFVLTIEKGIFRRGKHQTPVLHTKEANVAH